MPILDFNFPRDNYFLIDIYNLFAIYEGLL